MTRNRFTARITRSLAALAAVVIAAAPAAAQGVDEDAKAALNALYRNTPAAKTLSKTAKGILIFPKIVKAGFVVGAQYGQGTLFKAGKPAAML